MNEGGSGSQLGSEICGRVSVEETGTGTHFRIHNRRHYNEEHEDYDGIGLHCSYYLQSTATAIYSRGGEPRTRVLIDQVFSCSVLLGNAHVLRGCRARARAPARCIDDGFWNARAQ